MALLKTIVQFDGVPTRYHRILYMMKTTNHHNTIAVLSYINSDFRDSEKLNAETPLYKQSTTYETDYDESMTIEDAYAYLKSLPKFEGAEDV